METREFRIAERTVEGRNVLRLTLQSPVRIGDVTPSVFVRIHNGAGDSRPYTPLWTTPDTIHHAIKVYEGGLLSSHLAGLAVGDSVRVSAFEHKRRFVANEHRSILMVCGGAGVTPMYQVLRHALHMPECESSFTLLFYNSSADDVFLAGDLAALERLGGARLRVRYVATGGAGRHAAHSSQVAGPIREECAARRYDFVYACGTDGFLEAVCGAKTPEKEQGEVLGVLGELGFTSESVYKF